ncbi:uncharacterized protein LOC113772117 isoform X2 [Coffea eugenioides]|uniref:uncharacterized protein LOC113772117 isoform X2 n=1 Tax=Coffea eugenioides TaxID=49369 RepID=UPI000F610D40|nr:uncharacterized protein LOC113772117 isoform X2 [Coffea eugenioides]
MTFLGLVEAFEYDGESSPKCFFSRMRSVSTTSLLVVSTGSFALDIAFGIGGLPEKLNATIPTGAFTKLDFEAYNGPSRGYNQLGSIGYNTEQFFLQLRKQQFHVSKNCLRLACTRLEVVAGELSKSCHGRQQKQNCFWIGERCIVHFKLHAACFLIYQCN